MNGTRRQAVGAVLGAALVLGAGTWAVRAAEKSSSARPAPAASKAEVGAARALSDAFATVAEHIKPSVVTVFSAKTVRMPRFQWPFGDENPFREFFGDEDQSRRPRQRQYQFRQSGMGSGIVIDARGRILTNNHVVQDVDEIKVKLATGATYDAEVVGSDPGTDLAVIRIKGKVPADLVPAPLGDSDSLRVGEWVLAVGAPFGYEQTVTAGIVSAKSRTGVERGLSKYEDFIQTDAAINPGNSGGPLVNIDGEVVGINTAIATGGAGQFAGVGFAIPVNMAKPILRDLIESGKVTRGMLGVIIQDITEDLAKQFGLPDTKGALVAQINKDSPADKAGFKPGDAIVRYNRRKVETMRSLRNMVAETAPGARVEIGVIRDGKELTLTATLGELTAAAVGGEEPGQPSKDAAEIGVRVETLTPDKAKAAGYEGEKGVLVADVDPEGPAAAAQIQAGDLITEVNHDKVATTGDFQKALTRAKGQESVLMLIKHGAVSRFAIVTMK